MNAIPKDTVPFASGRNGDLADPPSRRGRKPSPEKRDAILSAALRLFAARGVDGTATRDIAAAAATTERTLFKHFGSKGGLVQAVVETATFDLMRQTAFARIGEPSRFASLSEFSAWHRSFLVDRITSAGAAPDTYRVMLQELLRDAAFRDRYAGQWMARVFAPLVGHLEAMQAAGIVTAEQPADALAGAFFSLNLGYLVARFALATDGDWAGERDAERLVAMFATMCRPQT